MTRSKVKIQEEGCNDERKAPSFCLSNPSRRRQGEAGRGKKIETVEQETRPIRA